MHSYINTSKGWYRTQTSASRARSANAEYLDTKYRIFKCSTLSESRVSCFSSSSTSAASPASLNWIWYPPSGRNASNVRVSLFRRRQKERNRAPCS